MFTSPKGTVRKSPACRQEGETNQECVSRKIPEIKEEHPDWSDEQVQAVAYSICEESCSDKQLKETTMTVRSRGQFVQKHIGVPLEKSYTPNEDGTIVVRGYFTSDKIDEVGDIITKAATEAAVPKYRQWGNIRYMHMPKPVAKVVRIGKEDSLDWNEVEIHVIDPEAVFQVKNGLLKALSVGIIIRSWEDISIDEETGGWIINNYDLAEISLVDHPANYDAQLFLDEDKVITVNRELRQMVADHGFAVVSKALGAVTTPVTEEEFDMEQLEKTLQPEEEIVAEELTEEEEELELSVDEAEAEEAEEELELSVEEEALEEEEEEEVIEDVLEDMDVRLVEEDPENDPDSILFDSAEADEEKEIGDEEDESDTIAEEVIEDIVSEELSAEPDTVKEILPLLRSLLEVLSKAEAEAPEMEQPEAEKVEEVEVVAEEIPVADKVADLEFQVAALTEIVTELMQPAKRMGQAKGTVLPHEDVEKMESEKEEDEGSTDLLHRAVKNYLSKSPRVVIRERG